jgi:hypothetical protein
VSPTDALLLLSLVGDALAIGAWVRERRRRATAVADAAAAYARGYAEGLATAVERAREAAGVLPRGIARGKRERGALGLASERNAP